MALAGDFKDMAFTDVVQLYSHSRRTAMLVVNCPTTGKALGFFYFESGELVDAELGDVDGLEAVYRAMELKEGTFHVVLDGRSPRRRIFEPIGAMLLEGMRRMDEAEYAAEVGGSANVRLPPPPPREATLKLVRSPVGYSDVGQSEGEDMAGAELKGRVCPSCGKHFISGDVCPDDGVRLVVPGGPVQLDVPPPARTVPPPAPLSQRGPAVRGWWIAAAGLMVVLIVLGVIWVRRPRTVAGADEAPPPRAPAPAASASVVEAPAKPAPVDQAKPVPKETAPAPAPAPAPPPVTGVRGVTDKEILFGMSAAFSGSAKELGRQMKLGVETAFAGINEAGGIHGRNLRLMAVDDGYEPARTQVAMAELYDKHQVFGIIGNVGTPTAVVGVPYALDHKLLFFGAFTGASLLRRDPPDRYVFNYRASYAEETAAVVKYLVKIRRLRLEQIAVFAQQDAFGDAGFAGVAKAMRALRGGTEQPILRVGFKRNTVDVADAVARLREHPTLIKAIVMVCPYRAAAKFIEKMRDLYPTMIFTNVSFVGSTSLQEELNLLGTKYASGVIVTQVVPPVDSHSTTILKYKEALAKYFPGENPDYVSLEGYIAANLLAEGLRKVGRDIDTEKLVDALEQIRNLDIGIGTTLSFGLAEHQGSHKVWGTQLDDQGKYQILELE